MISAMVQARVGQTVKDYLLPRLFAPLGINNVDWETTPQGVTLGCAGLQISTEELSRFGQLLLQQGKWQGQQLIPAAWINFVTQKQIDNDGNGDWGEGYGTPILALLPRRLPCRWRSWTILSCGAGRSSSHCN